MDKFIPPLRSFTKKYKDKINKLFLLPVVVVLTVKKGKFGQGLFFKEVENIMNNKCLMCQAFPVGLVLPDDQKEDPEAFMKTRLTDENFKGEIQERFDKFIERISASDS